MSVLLKQGVCHEKTFPYKKMIGVYPKTPLPVVPKESHTEVSHFKIGAYTKIQSLDKIKTAIKNDGLVIIGVLVASNFAELEG